VVVFSQNSKSFNQKVDRKQKATIGEIASSSILSCHLDTPLFEAAKLMAESKCSSVIIVDDVENPVGIWTEGDALDVDLSSESVLKNPISTFMSSPIETISSKILIDEASSTFRARSFRHFLVVDDLGRAVGVVSQTDVVLCQKIDQYLFNKSVGTILRKPLLILNELDSIVEASHKMRASHVDVVAIRDATGKCIGIVTECDIVNAIAGQKISSCLGDVASRPIKTISQDSSLFQARNSLAGNNVRHMGITDDSGVILGILSFTDILNSVEQQYVEQLHGMLRDRDAALKNSTQNLQLAEKVIEASLDGIIITDTKNTIQYVNSAFTHLTGYSPEEAIGKTPTILRSGRHDAKFYKEMWQKLLKNGYWQGEVWNRRKNNDIYPEKMTITAICNDSGKVSQYAAIFSDISDRKNYENQIQNLAYYDILTELPNRRLFGDRLEQAVLNAERHKLNPAVLFLDLDLFKRINDTLGHSVGDKVLRQISQRLSACLRGGDSVSRLGGDEFTILLQELDGVDNAAKLARRLINEVAKPLYVGEKEFFLTASIGVAVYPFDGENGEALVQNADTAMYKAKELGRNNFQLYTKSMNDKFQQKLSLENHLRRAMQHDQFYMVYQPKTDAKTGKTASLEALARWEHPDIGLISPLEFIPVAEAMGLIAKLSEVFFEKVCTQWRQWVSVGLPKIPVAVNISLHHFKQPNLAENLIKIAKDKGMDLNYLEIEITESTFMDQMDVVVKELNILRDHGVSVAIDDFGTGYSSFSYLKRIPIDTLKIDKSFVDEISNGEDGAGIVSAIIAMAHQLKLSVVAEGVETEEELAFLREHDCDLIQGYIFAKPMKANQVISYIKD